MEEEIGTPGALSLFALEGKFSLFKSIATRDSGNTSSSLEICVIRVRVLSYFKNLHCFKADLLTPAGGSDWVTMAESHG